jgi:CRISPR-associated protein Cmr3
MRLFIRPNDVLMFRDGKPFSGGDDHFARGACPPPPSTIYGALRSHILSLAWSEFDSFAVQGARIPASLTEEVGSPQGPGSLELGQFLLARSLNGSTERFFPVPRDISREKGGDEMSLRLLQPQELPGVRTDLPATMLHMWHATEQALEQASGFLSHEDMKNYLNGKTPGKTITAADLFQPEERTGTRKSRSSRSVESGGLYSVEYFRFEEDCGFALEVRGTRTLPTKGILRLGGDHRSAGYSETTWQEIETEPIKKIIERTGRFKIILLSPAIFGQGWLPAGIAPDSLEGSVNEVQLRIRSAALGRPLGMGGFDIARKAPKTMKRAVPPGSVYYAELIGGNVDALFESVWLKPVSDERTNEGFGISLIGGY